MTGSCGRCRVMPAEPGEAWCTDCLGEESYGDYVAGVHVSQLDGVEPPWSPAGVDGEPF